MEEMKPIGVVEQMLMLKSKLHGLTYREPTLVVVSHDVWQQLHELMSHMHVVYVDDPLNGQHISKIFGMRLVVDHEAPQGYIALGFATTDIL